MLVIDNATTDLCSDDGDEVDEISHALDGDTLDIDDGDDEDGGPREDGEEEEPEVYGASYDGLYGAPVTSHGHVYKIIISC